MKTLQELEPMIIEWAGNKNILRKEIAPKQRLKLLEECGELAGAIAKNKIDDQKDAVGDIFVVLTILAYQTSSEFDIEYTSKEELESYEFSSFDSDICDILNSAIFDVKHVELYNLSLALYSLAGIAKELKLDLTECVNLAWNEIKDRTGRTENGVFIKD
jgi:hypothetical protein